ncbi:lipid-A-disaccharide synthase [Candidatus Endolissoclinum faulkneri L5]|uniref:Lipid-A-disaccharide synthase n=1 Tax=Candidatus Endolissoclinum faulkneri L5 TaxID=1401328 RepID=V9TWL5_9PROT|nr:lipid-A-disaccharide synthase [Candidatus Endolissoclinum faulkneri]AHC73690.1 lipid-A-disaccharide synthase [Candidatus Endolissoclinum faulkneri L5]
MSSESSAEVKVPLIYIIAGESSGDTLGAGLIRALRAETRGNVEIAGIGGDLMSAEGLQTIFPITEIAVMGLIEILPKVPKILERIRQTVADVRSRQPAAVVTIDSKAFAMRVNKQLHALRVRSGNGPKLIHWVPPTVWAWGPRRAEVIAKYIDHLLTLYPFEAPYFAAHGLPTTFVGHPAALTQNNNSKCFKSIYGLPLEAPVLGVFPGSRLGEVKRLLPIFGNVVDRLAVRYQGLRIVLPTVSLVVDKVREAITTWRSPVTIVTEHRHKTAAFSACTAALAASGTVTLELSLAGVPTVAAYRLNALTATIARRLIDPDSVVLTNKLMGKRVIPQFLQEDCTPERLTVAIKQLFDDPRARAKQGIVSESIRQMLIVDGEDPSIRAARKILTLLSESC